MAQLELRLRELMGVARPAKKTGVKRVPAKGRVDAELTEWCRGKARELGLPELAKKVEVAWNSRMRTTAGRAWWPVGMIELNPKLREFSEEEIWRTLKHELAHLVAYARAGRRKIQPHGVEWKLACAELGIAGESTYHSLPLKGRKMKKKYAYTCPSCGAQVLRVRAMKRAAGCYDCCKKYNGGRYHDRFRLVKTVL